jgi:enoyl-CoA hydratase/carnithine racemase
MAQTSMALRGVIGIVIDKQDDCVTLASVPPETIALSRRDGVAVLTLCRPERHNAINLQMARELPAAWQELARDPEVAVIIVTGAGERAFCTGFDVGEVASGAARAGADGDDGSPLASLRFTALHNRCWKPVITALNGMVCGGGLHFVADSDLVIAADSAELFDTHVNVGLVAGLEAIGLGRRLALEPVLRMALAGRRERMSAARAYALGLVGEVVAPAALLPRAHELARQIAECSPAALAATKRALWQSLDVGIERARELGWAIIEEYWGHPDIAEGAAAFRERRAPRWQPLSLKG